LCSHVKEDKMDRIIIAGLRYRRSATTITTLCHLYQRLLTPPPNAIPQTNLPQTTPPKTSRSKKTLFTIHVSPTMYVERINTVFPTLRIKCPVCDVRYITAVSHFVRVAREPSVPRPLVDRDIIVSCHACAGDNLEFNRKLLRVNRVKVWLVCFGPSLTGECIVCGAELHLCGYFELGHDTAYSRQGVDASSNVRPIHADCNRVMATRSFSDMLIQRLGHHNIPPPHMTVEQAGILAKQLTSPASHKQAVCTKVAS